MERTLRRDLIWALALVVLLGAVWVARSDVARAGDPGPEGVDVVYIAVGDNFPDSLGAGPIGGITQGPIIIVPTNPPIPAATQAELLRLDPKNVVIVGGTGVVSSEMEAAIDGLLNIQTNIVRIAGSNRYETNALLSASVFPVTSFISIPASAFIIDGDPADFSYSSSSASAANNEDLFAPLVLPAGTKVVGLTVFGDDTDADGGGAAAGDDLQLAIVEVTYNGTNTTSCAAFLMSAGPFTGTCDISVDIDSTDNAYEIRVSGADGDPVIRAVLVEIES